MEPGDRMRRPPASSRGDHDHERIRGAVSASSAVTAFVLSQALLMVTGKPEVPERSAVGAQLIRDHFFWREPLLSHQLAHELGGRAPVSPALNQNVEDLAFVIDGAP